jgi:hypothetical protein
MGEINEGAEGKRSEMGNRLRLLLTQQLLHLPNSQQLSKNYLQMLLYLFVNIAFLVLNPFFQSIYECVCILGESRN